MMRQGLRSGLVAAAVMMLAAPAVAQVHLQINGGMTRAARDDRFVSGELGVRLGFFEVDGEVGRFNDVLPNGIADQLTRLLNDRGLGVQAKATLPATYALASVRLISPSGVVRPFISGGYGVARVEPRLDIDISGLPVSDVFGIAVAKKENDQMVTAGAGLRFAVAPRVHIDATYRYVWIFSDFRPDTNIDNDRVLTSAHTLSAGLGVRF
jgi:opacity protein-like surface antigen